MTFRRSEPFEIGPLLFHNSLMRQIPYTKAWSTSIINYLFISGFPETEMHVHESLQYILASLIPPQKKLKINFIKVPGLVHF